MVVGMFCVVEGNVYLNWLFDYFLLGKIFEIDEDFVFVFIDYIFSEVFRNLKVLEVKFYDILFIYFGEVMIEFY